MSLIYFKIKRHIVISVNNLFITNTQMDGEAFRLFSLSGCRLWEHESKFSPSLSIQFHSYLHNLKVHFSCSCLPGKQPTSDWDYRTTCTQRSRTQIEEESWKCCYNKLQTDEKPVISKQASYLASVVDIKKHKCHIWGKEITSLLEDRVSGVIWSEWVCCALWRV